MKNKKNLLIVISITLVILLAVYVVYVLNSLKNNCPLVEETKQYGKIIITNDNKVISFGETIPNFSASDGRQYIKIKINFENRTDTDVKARDYLYLLYNGEERTAMCYDKARSHNLDHDDMFPEIIKASGTTSGYIYCNGELTTDSILKISYITDSFYDENGYIDYDETILKHKLND